MPHWAGATSILATLLLLILSSNFSNHAVGFTPLETIKIAQPVIINTSGESVRTVEVGQQVSVRISTVNNADSELPVVIYIEVRDGDGVAQYLAWQSLIMKVGRNYTFETSWTPDRGCTGNQSECGANYQIRTLAITNSANPQVLSNVHILDGISLIDTPAEINGQYTVTSGNETYVIKYSMTSGDIQMITWEPSLLTITIKLERIAGDTALDLTFPYDLVRNMFPDFRNEPDLVPGVFVDAVPVDPKNIQFRGGILTFSVDVSQGSETVELIGTSLL